MSAMTITVGTGLQGGANRSGYVHDDLSRYPDLAFSEGYVFRAGTGWWQEWESIFPTYDAAAASDVSTNYTIGPAADRMYQTAAGTGWTEPYSGLFPSNNTTGSFPAPVVKMWSLVDCPPFTANPPLIPAVGADASVFATNATRRAFSLEQTTPASRPSIGSLQGRPALQFSGSQFHKNALGGTQNFPQSTTGGNFIVVVFATLPASAATETIFHASNSAGTNVGFRMSLESGKSALEVALSSTPTVIANPGPAIPNVTINDGNVHVVGIGQSGTNNPTLWANTDGTVQDVTFGSNVAGQTAVNMVVGSDVALSRFMNGYIAEVFAFSATDAANAAACVAAVKARWAA